MTEEIQAIDVMNYPHTCNPAIASQEEFEEFTGWAMTRFAYMPARCGPTATTTK